MGAGYREGNTLYTTDTGPIPRRDSAPSSGMFLLVALLAFAVALWVRKRRFK